MMSTSTWKTDPQSGEWNDGGNWSSGQVPTGTASFAASSRTAITFAAASAATVQAIEFADAAPSYTFTIAACTPDPALTIDGAGIVNRALSTQSFIVASNGTYDHPQLAFAGAASAGESQVSYYAGPVSLETTHGGGTIAFRDEATAGSASFTVRTGKQPVPRDSKPPSTLGGQVVFSGRSTAGTARFSIWGTLGVDGYTFGSVVFHDQASADKGTYINQGGTVPKGDGGNTQFYDHSSAEHGIYLNHGGTAWDKQIGGANGGDVAFDGLATGADGQFYNYPASVAGASGGVTSFNNNPNYPKMAEQGASAGHGTYFNFGATADFPGGGGHTELTARHGCPTADHATIHNFGSALGKSSGAGHTIFSVGSMYHDEDPGEPGSGPSADYFSSAGNATVWNYPGVAGGFTVFEVFGKEPQNKFPTAADGIFHNLGGDAPGLAGGYTWFKGQTTAGNATLIAYGGTGGGQGGRIRFSDQSSGGAAHIRLAGNAVLDLSGHTGGLTIGTLELAQGVIKIDLRPGEVGLTVSERLALTSTEATVLSFPDKGAITLGQEYAVLRAPNLADCDTSRFSADRIGTAEPTFSIEGDTLKVLYRDPT